MDLSLWIHSQERILQDLQCRLVRRMDKSSSEDVLDFRGWSVRIRHLFNRSARVEQWDIWNNSNNNSAPGLLSQGTHQGARLHLAVKFWANERIGSVRACVVR